VRDSIPGSATHPPHMRAAARSPAFRAAQICPSTQCQMFRNGTKLPAKLFPSGADQFACLEKIFNNNNWLTSWHGSCCSLCKALCQTGREKTFWEEP
jgi:hypothetical protein